MTRSDGDEHLEERLRLAKPGEMAAPDFGSWVQAHAEDVEALQAQARPGEVGRSPWALRLGSLSRVAAVVLVVLTLGFALGRFSVPPTLDVEGLRLELEASLRQDVIEPIGVQWHATLQAKCDQLRTEILQQLHQDMGDFATRTLAASRSITDQRMTQLILLIEAARERDRRRVAFALEQIETNRQRDRVQLGSGLQLLASRSVESADVKTN